MMPRLQIQLLGTCQLLYDNEPVTTMQQARTQSLLAYLLLHRDSPQARQQLAFLFWPETSDAQALTNLRRELHHLRHSLPDADHYLQIEPRTVQWRANASFKLDVADFEALLEQANQAAQAGHQAAVRAALAGALALYRGRLLPTCYDDWILPPREQLERRFERGLEQLIVLLEEQRDYLTAIRYAQQMLHHDALHEPTYRRLMRLHVLNGDRASALRVYHTCASSLQRELEVAPNQETQAAYARLLNMDRSPGLPAQPAVADRSVVRLVGRHSEWQQLRTAWRKAVQGQAHFVLVAGEAGIGKTRLVEELLESVGQQGIVAARARSYAAEGARAYAPVIEWLRAGHLRSTLDQLDDVWLTEVARLLPELLVERPALPRSEPLGERWQRQRLFEALARAVTGDGQPRLLLIDDLQWCDPETLEWMRYLLHYDLGARLLIVGTVRAEEIDPDHPLMALVRELQTSKQLTEVELGPLDIDDTTALAAQMAGQALTPAMMAQLYRETEGNPLFVMETMRADLGKGVEVMGSERLSFSPLSLPPKIHAVIQRRLAQLSPAARELASLAAVVGRSFTLNVLVQTGDLTEDALVHALDELWQRRIVREQSIDLYDFSHDRIREVAYDAISPARQRLLHRRVAQALETVHVMNLDAVSGQVAVHYEQAGLLEKAILYYKQASGVAQRIYAIVEAIDQLRKALRLLKSLPPTPERSQQELEIQLTLGPFLETLKGYAAPEVEQVYTRAQELCQQIGDRQPQQLIWALLGLRAHYFMRAEHGRAREVAEQLLTLVQSVHDPLLLAQAHRHLGTSLAHAGEFVRARVHLEQAIADHDDQQRSDQGMLYGRSPSVMSRSIAARTLWVLGYPDQAMQRIQEALNLAQDLSHPHDLAVALAFAAQLHQYRREVEAAQTQAEATIILSTKHGYSFWFALGTMLRGWAFAEQEQSEVGMAQMRQGLAAAESIGIAWARPYFLGLLAEAHGRIGQVEEGLTLLAESLSLVEATQDHFWEAELYRLRGELLRRQATNTSGLSSALSEAERCFRQALELARCQQAKSWELRAATSLSVLWQQQGRQAEAHQLLAPVYAWFSEGFDTPDLQAAQALLDALPSHP